MRTFELSRAFVKEPDGNEVFDDLPDRVVSPHRNFVTPDGLAAMDAELARLHAALATAKAGGDKAAGATLSRDLRYWTARRASAELVEPPTGPEVRFGSYVEIERRDGRRQVFQITGEDEADPAAGRLSYVAPLARALIGREEDDELSFMDDTLTILAVSAQPLSRS